MSRETQNALALFIAACDFSIYLMAQIFAADISAGGSPMSPELYGAAVYYIPAIFWISVQSNAAMIGVIGCLIAASSRKYYRWGWLMSAIGNSFCVALFGLFAALVEETLLRAICIACGIGIGGTCAVISGRCFFYGGKDERTT